MKVAFPVENLQGLDSQVCPHFGSAPGYVIVDTETDSYEQIENSQHQHSHGMCQPLKNFGDRPVNGVAVAGIGMGALNKLQAAGVQVYRVVEGTVADNLNLLKEGKLPVFSAEFTCAGHQGGCGHHHHH